MPIKNRDIHVKTSRGILIVEPGSGCMEGDEAGGADCGDRRKPKIALGGGKSLRRIYLELLADQFRPIHHGLLNETREIHGWSRRLRLFDQVVASLAGKTERPGQIRIGGLQIVLRLNQK